MAFAKKENLSVVGFFKETQSAYANNRPHFNNMVDRVKNGEANGILIWEVSRLSRNMQDSSTIDNLVKRKQLLKITTPNREYLDIDGEDFMFSMELVISRQYSKEVSKRTRRGLRFKISNKEWPGCAPLGYVNINCKTQTLAGEMTPYKKAVQKIFLERQRKDDYTFKSRVEPDPIKSTMVKKVFEEFSSGNYSLAVMQDRMNAAGLNGKTGKPVSKSCLVNMLTNPFYYGVMRYNDELNEGSHTPIISKALFDVTQQQLKERNKPIKKRWSFDFTGLIECGNCGCGITAEKKKNKYVYYHCTGMRNKKMIHPCREPMIREKDLRNQLGKQVKKIQINDMLKELLTEAIRRSHKKEKEMHSIGIQEWENMYKTAEDRLNKLFELFYGGAINKDEFSQRKEEIMDEKQKAKEHLDTHGEAQKSWLNYSEKLIITTNHVYQVFKDGTPEEVKLLMKTVGKNFILKDGNVSFQFKEPFNMIARLSEHKSSNKIDWLRR